ncbi:malate dehydrogenase [Spirochaeta lutea]|uniref:Malate dehydrogenase n=1 Tax=Spirochaeta lutea TaxID=1480694 RepID=A0A098QSL9_9SPIO|nr:malate dehydrogenase [Spirochaeta lutea]KGE70830.1 malate dehydrogenase [Spirochaeta lutea]
MSKVAIIGAGNVGATAAYCVAEQNVADIVMVDVIQGFPQSKAIDFLHASPLRGYRVRIAGANEYEAIKDAKVVIHTAGIPRKPGMDRMDLLKTNVNIAREAARNIAKYAPEAVVIAVANPLDIIAAVCLRETGFPKERIAGMAGVLDSTRFRYFIAERLNVQPQDVQAMVLGGHGDTMVPLSRYASVGGFPIGDLLDEKTITELSDRTRTGGGEIVSYLKKGSAYYAPGASAAKMAEAVLKDEKRILPASAYLEGEYGYHGIFLGVPVLLGRGGIERIYELELTPEEKSALDNSAKAVEGGVELLNSLG